MNRKLIFLDIDGTLTTPGSNTPPESAMKAVRLAREKGHKVFLCSGRNPGMMAPVLALGFDGLIVSGGCDVDSPKALRASMGALLRFPVVRAEDAVTEIQKCTSLGMPALAAVLDEGAADVRTVSLSGGALLVLGNEGSGVSPQAAKACTQHIIIPMAGRAESLNAAAAGAVLLWELLGRRK